MDVTSVALYLTEGPYVPGRLPHGRFFIRHADPERVLAGRFSHLKSNHRGSFAASPFSARSLFF